MKLYETPRGFVGVSHPTYENAPSDKRIVQESSAIGDYPDSMDKPGSSFLWVGEYHHLNREQVRELFDHLGRWLGTGSLEQ